MSLLAIHGWGWGQKVENWGIVILEYEKRGVSLQRDERNGKSDKLRARSKGDRAKDTSSPQKILPRVRPDVKKMEQK